MHAAGEAEDKPAELWKSTFVGIALWAEQLDIHDPAQFHKRKDLVQITVTFPYDVDASGAYQTADEATYIMVERLLLTRSNR